MKVTGGENEDLFGVFRCFLLKVFNKVTYIELMLTISMVVLRLKVNMYFFSVIRTLQIYYKKVRKERETPP